MTGKAKPAASSALLEKLFTGLYERSGAEEYGLAADTFFRILAEVGAKYLPPDAQEPDVWEFYGGIRVEELALARACAAGSERAWDVFLNRFREKLYDAGRAIARDDTGGRELADSLYASLFGTETREGRRVSKLESYMGRGSLEGWLRTVLAQEFINRYRKQKKSVSMDEQVEAGVQFAAAQTAAADPPITGDGKLEQATDEALASLAAEDRFILGSYFLDGRTLAEVARTLGVHESTISRRLEKLTGSVRKKIVAGLERRGMSRRQAEEALETDVRDISVNIRASLAQETPAKSFHAQESKD